MSRTQVHMVRHGEVHNPEGILYGRLPGYGLSETGREQARRVADHLAGADVTALLVSPMQRAQETAAPIAEKLGLEIVTEDRLIEAANAFEGMQVAVGDGALRKPEYWPLLRNPFRPSWGEPYREIAARMQAAVADARDAARGHEAVIVSHQLPVWIARQAYEKMSFVHDPRTRQCSLASLTSLTFDGDRYVGFTYAEPAGDLLPDALKAGKKFVGGA